MNTNTPGIGDNVQNVDYAAEETSRLDRDYSSLAQSVVELVEEANQIPLPIADDDGKKLVTRMIKRLRDSATNVEGLREIEKLPHLRRGNAVDQWFGRLRVALRKDNKRDQDQIGDKLQAELTDYDRRLLAAEQERRRIEAEKAAREMRERLAAEQKAREEAEAARLAAERARLAETRAAKGKAAEEAALAASAATVEAKVAEARAEEAQVQTFARPADIMRRRSDDGVLSTMGTEKFVEITELQKLDLEVLRPFIKFEALEQALRGLAASRGYSNDERMQIAGAKFGTRAKSVVR